jgi:hypothetical protein
VRPSSRGAHLSVEIGESLCKLIGEVVDIIRVYQKQQSLKCPYKYLRGFIVGGQSLRRRREYSIEIVRPGGEILHPGVDVLHPRQKVEEYAKGNIAEIALDPDGREGVEEGCAASWASVARGGVDKFSEARAANNMVAWQYANASVFGIVVRSPAEEAFGPVESVVRIGRDGAPVHECVFSDTTEEISKHGNVWGSFRAGELWVIVEESG